VEAWATSSAVVVLAREEEAAAVSIFMLGVWGEVAWPSKRGKIRQCASVAWARGGQEGSAVGHMGYPGQRILGPNLRPKWVRADSFGQRFLFGLHH
jgi:hypothetical protein